MKAIGPKEVGVSEVSHLMNSDEYGKNFRMLSTASMWWNLTRGLSGNVSIAQDSTGKNSNGKPGLRVYEVWCVFTEDHVFGCFRSMLAGAAIEVAVEVRHNEQVVCQDLIGELLSSLSRRRKEPYVWEKESRQVFMNHKPRESVSCVYLYVLYYFNIEGGSVHLTWNDPRLKGSLNFEPRANLGVDDASKETVIILKAETDPQHWNVNRLRRLSGCEIQVDTSRNFRLHELFVSSRDTRASR